MLPNQQKNRFYNPIKQNRTHIKWLQKYVGEDVPLFSIIVFSERCELKNLNFALWYGAIPEKTRKPLIFLYLQEKSITPYHYNGVVNRKSL